jgi:hypothetical protein
MVLYGMAADLLRRHRNLRPHSPVVIEVALAKIAIKPVGHLISRRRETAFGNEPTGLVHAAPLRVFAKDWIQRLRRWQAAEVYPTSVPFAGRGRCVGGQIWMLHKFLKSPAGASHVATVIRFVRQPNSGLCVFARGYP